VFRNDPRAERRLGPLIKVAPDRRKSKVFPIGRALRNRGGSWQASAMRVGAVGEASAGSRICALGVTVLMLSAALASGAQGSSGSFPGRNGRIVFAGAVPTDGPWQIWSVTPSGGGLRPLTPASSGCVGLTPAVSPNGKEIVYACDDDLWKMNANGGNQTQLTRTSASEAEPTWSPDGKQILFHRGGDTRYASIWVMNAGGGRERLLVKHGGPNPSWSPDGTRIAYSRDSHIYVAQIRGGRPKNLTPGSHLSLHAQDPDWSPDGHRIVFTKNGDLWLMNANGSDQHAIAGIHTIATSPWPRTDPSWSPDGRWIVFIGQDPDTDTTPPFGLRDPLYLIHPNGTDLHPITPPTSFGSSPTWGR
jgi:Tol biopolymer transport system component